MKRTKRSPGISKSEAYCPPTAVAPSNAFHNPPISAYDGQPNTNSHIANSLTKETERSLIGSLVDSYGFKEEGLVKKTVSVTVGGVSHHLVSYYTVADVMNHKFTTPSKDSRFQNVIPRPELISKQNFRTPIDEVDSVDRMDERTVYTYTYPPRNTYEMTNQTISQRSLSLPTPPLSYPPSGVFGNYGVSPQHIHYETLGPNHSGPPFPSQYPSSSGLYSTPIKSEHYPRSGFRQQRFNSVSGVPSETARTHMPPVTSKFARRSSNYEQATSIDTGIAGMSSSSESKLTPDSGYSSQGFFSGSTLRDGSNPAPHYTAQRSLPTPTHHPYDRPPTHVYHPSENSVVKDHAWPIANVNTGFHHHHHGHHMSAPQQQWASTGT
ncbi:hypothetical protein K3495_g3469 [Podosphaera aphanis]|nr:hypothetical protein K3495_g3469 [Podosphaera aphanis]